MDSDTQSDLWCRLLTVVWSLTNDKIISTCDTVGRRPHGGKQLSLEGFATPYQRIP